MERQIQKDKAQEIDKDTKDGRVTETLRELKISRRRQQPRDRIIENRGREGI